mgnify:CR=1 FL=1
MVKIEIDDVRENMKDIAYNVQLKTIEAVAKLYGFDVEHAAKKIGFEIKTIVKKITNNSKKNKIERINKRKIEFKNICRRNDNMDMNDIKKDNNITVKTKNVVDTTNNMHKTVSSEDTESSNVANTLVPNPWQNKIEQISPEDTNGIDCQAEHCDSNDKQQLHNKENITKNIGNDLIDFLCKNGFVKEKDKDKVQEKTREFLHSYTLKHSQETEIQKMTCKQMQSLLREKGMKISGNKSELMQRLIVGPTGEPERKSCEAPFSELFFAYAICDPNAASYTDDKKFQQQCIITDALKEQYKQDIKTKPKEFLDKYFENCKQISHKFRNESNITETDKIEVFVQGKCITNQIILELTQSIKERTQKKADLYIRVNGKRWIGISVKTTPGDPKSNWSIELLIGKQDPELKKNIKNTREDLNKENGIGRDWRKNKDYNRKKYNNIMYGHNVYKKQIDDWVMKPENKSNMQNIIAKAAGSSNHFEMYECNGCEYRDLNRIHDEIKNASEFTILPDIPENSKYIEETFKQKTHYSNTAAKMWYYIILNNTVKYRIEIRWKGEPYASPQLLLFDV